jgi:hypothetical protein
MVAQINHANAATDLARTQRRWEVPKAIAAIGAAVAAMAGIILAVAHLIRP